MSAAPIRTAAVLGLLVGLLAAGQAAATTVQVVAPRSAQPRTPDVAVNANGRAVAVWTGTSGNGFAVFGRLRPSRTGAWGAVVRLSGVAPARPLVPTVAVGEDGGAIAVWRLDGGAVESATLPAGSATAWTRRPVAAGGEGFVSPALTAGGPTVLVWADRAGATWRARWAHFAGTAWQVAPPLDLSAAGVVPSGGDDTPPDLAVGERGDAAVIWPGPAGPPTPAPSQRVAVALWPRGFQEWQPATVLSAAGAHGDVGVGAGGQIGATWVEKSAVRAAIRDPQAAAWPAPETIVDGQAATPAFPHITINVEGYAVVVWGETEGDLSLRARVRSGASDLWGPERTVFDDFQFFSVLELANVQAVVDDDRVSTVAWTDPEGPGSASAYAARATSGAWDIAAQVPILEDIDETSMAASAHGGALLVTPRARIVNEPHIDLVAAAFPPPATFTLSAEQLKINQRISQAAVRRMNAVLARLRGSVRGEDVRNGTLGASVFGDGVTVSGTPTGATVASGPIAPLDIAPPRPGAPVRLSAAQLRINQKISQAAIVRAGYARNLLTLGLTGEQVVDGTIGAAKLLPGLTISGAVPSATPLPDSPDFHQGASGNGQVTLSAEQLQINQRISQAAVLRSNWLVERLEGGLRGIDFRAAGLRAEDLVPGLRTG